MLDLAFLNPWILGALLTLPVIYLLLRIFPPPPKIITLPTIWFLQDLQAKDHVPSKTPWWILLLRLLIAALVIVALAGPIYKPSAMLEGTGPLRLIIDNSWAAAPNWNTMTQSAEKAINRAKRAGRNVYILPTATTPGQPAPKQNGPMTAAQALAEIKALKPQPWPAAYEQAATSIPDSEENIQSIWIGHGIIEPGVTALQNRLRDQGPLLAYAPAQSDLPLALQWNGASQEGAELIIRAETNTDRSVTIQSLNEQGAPMNQQTLRLEGSRTAFTMGGHPASIRILGQQSAAAMLYLDENTKRRHVGILAPEDDAEDKPLIEAGYYLERALEPYAEMSFGSAGEILSNDPSLLILPDIGGMPPETLGRLEDWVNEGGVLLRFSGPNTVKEAANLPLSPVQLRAGGRAMDGAMTWEDPATLAPFPEASPFYGIALNDEITIKRQVLAEPQTGLEEKIWAGLSDGTPLITAAAQGDGLLVLIHTTATPAWSDFAISGAYVEILRRILALSGQSGKAIQNLKEGSLNPEWVLDGFGTKKKPGPHVKPIPATDITKTTPAPQTPPGLYTRPGYQFALNLGAHIDSIRSSQSLFAAAERQIYERNYEAELRAPLLLIAACLFALDWIIMLILSGTPLWRRTKTAQVILLCALCLTVPLQAHAQQERQHTQYSTQLYLAYIETGNSAVDSTSRRGLRNLGQALTNRTSAEPEGVVALNPERDELAFFPVIYWPITQTQKPLSTKALEKIQHYLDHGGTILIDKKQRASRRSDPQQDQKLQSLIGALNIPPMQPVPEDHVLGKSFYLLDHYPGLYSGDRLWVERTSTGVHDGVSSIIIGSHDWAGAWAMAENGTSTTRRYELSLRFGINWVMYALTGNYKADQVHLPAILERLGK